jgi:hypothetical protein
MTTISFPADAVVNGATEIQATTFAIVPADYVAVPYSSVQQFRTRNGAMPELPQFKSGIAPAEWSFYMRKDLTGGAAAHRNLLGVQVFSSSDGQSAFSTTLGKNINLTVQSYRARVYNWYPVVLTLTDSTPITIWSVTLNQIPVFVDPETGAFLTGDGTHRSLTEASGFLMTQVAANKPSLAPLINAASGVPVI